MEAVVSDILQRRKQEPGGLRQTALLSLGAHAAGVAVLLLLPILMPAQKRQPRVVMNISLGGTPGPRTGGTQMLGGRRIDAALPSAAPQISKNVLPSPPVPPKMTLPDPKANPRTPPKTTVASKDPKGTATGRGAESQVGTARAETGAKGQGFGLSSAGGGTGGRSTLDTTNFCCPEYIIDMVNRITKNWSQQQEATGVVFVKYTIQRSGQLTDIQVETSSGNPSLDLASQRALVNTRMLAPLPAAFPEPQLTVHLEFQYERR
jgi:periplasmic protein TonB